MDLTGVPDKTAALRDDDEFLRRLHPNDYDHDRGLVFARAFENDDGSDRFSVNCRRWTTNDLTLAGHSGFGLLALTHQHFKQEDQTVVHTAQGGNSAHCDVIGDKPIARRRRLRGYAGDPIVLPVTPGTAT